MNDDFSENAYDENSERERRLLARYVVVTLVLFVPLILAFASLRNLYPFAASTEMMMGGEPQAGRTFYILRGETVEGETFDLPPIELTNALTGNIWSLVAATVENRSFRIPSPHPSNVALAVACGGVDKLSRGERLGDLMRAWGAIFNSRLPVSSPRRLRAIRLEEYSWSGKDYVDQGHLNESWRAEL